MADGIFTPGAPLGAFQPGMSGVVNPLSLMLAGIYSGNPVGGLSTAGQLGQNAIAQQHAQAVQTATLALQRAQEARAVEQARKASEGLQAVSGSVFSQLAPDLQTEANRRAIEGLGNIPGGPGILANVFARQAGLVQPEAPAPTGLMKEAEALGFQPGTAEYARFIRDVRLKPETVVNVGERTAEAKAIADRKDLVARYGPKSREVKAFDIGQLTAGQQTSMGQIEPARQMLTNIEDLVGTEAGAGVVDLSGTTLGLRARAAASPTFSRAPGMNLTDEEAQLATYTTQLSNTMLALMRGAQVGPAEQAMFERQLPVMGQDENVFRSNLAATKKNLEYLIDLYKAQAPSLFDGDSPAGGLTDAEEARRQELLRKAGQS